MTYVKKIAKDKDNLKKTIKTDVSFGGQAVIEGVMMRSPNFYSIATLKDGKIKVKLQKEPMYSKKAYFNIPIIRGIINLFQMLKIGLYALTYSAEEAGEEEEKITKWEMFYSLLISFAFAILIFVVAPLLLTKVFVKSSGVIFNTIDGLIRIAFFFAYLYAISFSKEVQRVFAFHGAEHATINAYEKNEKLDVKRVKKYKTFHPRCGTSFIFIVLVVSIFVFSIFSPTGLLGKILSRIILIPLIAGISYEILKMTANLQGIFFSIITFPGKIIQKVTAKTPDEMQIKVAIAALDAVIKAEGKIKK